MYITAIGPFTTSATNAKHTFRSNLKMQHSCHPPTTFLTLPREIRDLIYEYALVAEFEVRVWTGSWRYMPPTVNGVQPADFSPLYYKLDINHDVKAATLNSLAFNLLRCGNSTVAAEAACTFYTQNEFTFFRDHNWGPIVQWLEGIGTRNRSLITRLAIANYRPRLVIQESDGTRPRSEGVQFKYIHPRSHHFAPAGKPCNEGEGEVDDINPSVETVFSLLGGSRDRLLSIRFYLDNNQLPGLRLSSSDEDDHDLFPFSPDLFYLIEKFCALYLCESAEKVEVLWVAQISRSAFRAKKTAMENTGWQIVRTRNINPVRFSPDELFVRGWMG